MEAEKITPEHLAEEIEKAVDFYKRTVEMATKFHEEQIIKEQIITEFHKSQCDRYFEHKLPMNNQIDATERAFGREFSAWNDTVFRLRSTLSTSLANLSMLSTQPLTDEEHPSALFVAKTADIDKYLEKFQDEMLEKRTDAAGYREKEREEIQSRFREDTESREKFETATANH